MKLFNLVVFILISACFVSAEIQTGNSLQNKIAGALHCYYERLFAVDEEDLRITILRNSDAELQESYDYEIRIIDTRNKKRLGYQTIWVHVLAEGKLLSKFPVSVQVEVRVPVIRTVRKISRREIVTVDMIRQEAIFIDSNWDSIIRTPEEVLGLSSKRVIRTGELLDRRILENPPVVERGDRIKLEIQSGSLVIGTTCIAKDDGAIGDEIDVISEPTGKRMKATISDNGLAVVEQE